MALTTTLNDLEWQRVQQIIQNVLFKRKFRFNEKTIRKVIGEHLKQFGMDSTIMECSYFQILFLNTLDQFVEEGILYYMDGIYIPSSYMVLHEYDTKWADLLYLYDDNSQSPVYINIHTLKDTKIRKKRDILLTGGYMDQNNSKLLPPNLSFQEIAYLYHSFLKEGANKEEAILHVLNYYHIKVLIPKDEIGRAVIIQNKKDVQKKILRKDHLLN